MYGVELYATVRPAVVDESLSNCEAGRRNGIDRPAVKKTLSHGITQCSSRALNLSAIQDVSEINTRTSIFLSVRPKSY